MGGPREDLDGVGAAAWWRAVLTEWRPSPRLLAAADDATAAFDDAVRRLMAADGAGIVLAGSVVGCHSAANATTHALTSLAASAPVFHRAGDVATATAIARSGHEPVAVPSGALIHRARRVPGCGVVIAVGHGSTDPAADVAWWEALLALAPRCQVVLDDTDGFRTLRPRPLGAFTERGGAVVGSLDQRLGAPGLHVGWLIARGWVAELAKESVMCESVGVAPLLLDLATRAIEATIADGPASTLLMRL